MRREKITITFSLILLAVSALGGQTPTVADPFKGLQFLEGTWVANTAPGPAGATSAGTYTFKKGLGGHILGRYSTTATCKAPADFDCDHGDMFYVFQEAPGQALKAIYFDNEGHVIHYDVKTLTDTSVVFLSDPSVPGPQFRLTYDLKNSSMSGKFQMRMPGQTEWKSYLEWSGPKK